MIRARRIFRRTTSIMTAHATIGSRLSEASSAMDRSVRTMGCGGRLRWWWGRWCSRWVNGWALREPATYRSCGSLPGLSTIHQASSGRLYLLESRLRVSETYCVHMSAGEEPAARSKAQHKLLKIRWGWRQADCQSAAGWQPAPQYFGGLSSHLVGRRPMRTARIGRPTTRRDWATKHRHDAFTRV